MSSNVFVDQLNNIRNHIQKNKVLKKYADIVEKQTSVNVEYFVAGLALVPFLLVLYGVGAGLISNLVGFVYPLYRTIHAIESSDKDDDTYWLIYWVVFAAFGVVEGFITLILYWIPFFYPLKIAFLLWLYLPQTAGAKKIYQSFILPQFKKHEDVIDKAFSKSADK